MAFSRGLVAVRTCCHPSPCARLSRAPTTTVTPSPVRNVARLGSLPDSRAGVRIEVPTFKGGTLGALGGRLYRWRRGRADQYGSNQRAYLVEAHPVVPVQTTGLGPQPRLQRVGLSYSGLQRRLHSDRTTIPSLSPWHLWWLASTIFRLASGSGRSALAGRRSNLDDVHGLLHSRPVPAVDLRAFPPPRR